MADNIFSFFADAEESSTAALHENYHENTKLTFFPEQWFYGIFGPSLSDPNSRLLRAASDLAVAETEMFVAEGGKQYPTAPKIHLPEPPEELQQVALHSILEQRFSSRSIPSGQVELNMVSALLRYAGGWNDARTRKNDGTAIRHRYSPSAGRLFPLELYIAMPSGDDYSGQYDIHHYQPNGHTLELINRITADCLKGAFVLCPDPIPPLVIFITASIKRQTWKYGDRAYRYALLEAGHVGQNICLTASALGLVHCPIAGYYDDNTHDILDIDGISEVTLYCFFAGQEPSEK